MSLIIFVGISPCWVTFDASKLFMVLLMNSGLIKPKEKLLMEIMFSRIAFILEWFWYFSMIFLIVAVSLSEEILVRPSNPMFWTIFTKYLLKISTSLLSSETTLLFSIKVDFSSFFCKRRFYSFPKKFIFSDVFYTEVILKLLFGLSKKFHTKVYLSLCADLDASIFSFPYLFKNLERFKIAFCKFLFINLAGLHLAYLSFKGAFLSSIIL